jgi:hypothetical protein
LKLEGSLYKLNMTRAASRNSREASINFMFEGSLQLPTRGAAHKGAKRAASLGPG